MSARDYFTKNTMPEKTDPIIKKVSDEGCYGATLHSTLYFLINSEKMKTYIAYFTGKIPSSSDEVHSHTFPTLSIAP